MISFNDVSKSFNGVLALNKLSLNIDTGEIFGLVGPNGAGKTTALRLLTGLLSSDSGSITIGEFDISKEPVKAKELFGYVPDKAFIYEKLTAREFLTFITSLYKVDKPKALTEIERLLELFGIKDVEDELVESFSQGMRQRLLFASALMHSPKVLLIDEPFAGLDPFGVRMLKGVIKELSMKGVTIFLATHSLHIAEEFCHRVGFINKGALVAIKSKEEIKGIEGGLEGLFLKLGE